MRYALFTLVFCSFQLCAQQAIQWQKAFGGSGIEEAYDIKRTTEGGYIVVGYSFSGNNGDVTGSKGGGDTWVVKINKNGSLDWQKALGGSGFDVAKAVQQTTDGGFIIAASTTSSNGDVTGFHSGTDFWIVKLNENGNIEWAKALGGSGVENAKSVYQTSDGGYIVAGQSNSTDGDVSNNKGFDDFWVVKLDANGDIQWQNSYGGSEGNEIANQIIQTNNGGYLIVGETKSNDGDVSGNHGNVDFWVVKISDNGILEWQKTFGGEGLESAYSVKQTFDSGYIVGGVTGSINSGQVSGGHGDFDFWAVKISNIGDLQWQKALGGSGPDYGRNIIQSNDSTYLFVGSTESTNGDVIGNDGGADFWLTNLSQSGDLIEQQTLGGSQVEVGWGITQAPDKTLALTGYAWSTDGEVSGVHGFSDYWIVKLSPTNTPTLTPTLTQLTLYPNPTNQQLTLQIPDNEPITSILITDLSGKTLKTERATQGKTLQIAMLPKGMYLLKATSSSGKVFCGKFIKE